MSQQMSQPPSRNNQAAILTADARELAAQRHERSAALLHYGTIKRSHISSRLTYSNSQLVDIMTTQRGGKLKQHSQARDETICAMKHGLPT